MLFEGRWLGVQKMPEGKVIISWEPLREWEGHERTLVLICCFSWETYLYFAMDTLKKACSFCIYQERTQQEVREKLKSWRVPAPEAEEIIAWLISENFINESRYARQFAGGKFRIKKWGRRKITYELKSKGVSPNVILEALAEIDEEEYIQTLKGLASAKAATLTEEAHSLTVQKKISAYLLMKGYEPNLVRELMADGVVFE